MSSLRTLAFRFVNSVADTDYAELINLGYRFYHKAYEIGQSLGQYIRK